MCNSGNVGVPAYLMEHFTFPTSVFIHPIYVKSWGLTISPPKKEGEKRKCNFMLCYVTLFNVCVCGGDESGTRTLTTGEEGLREIHVVYPWPPFVGPTSERASETPFHVWEGSGSASESLFISPKKGRT